MSTHGTTTGPFQQVEHALRSLPYRAGWSGMTGSAGVVIVGAGGAGASAANELRRIGYSGSLVLLNGETDPPYNRTTVNKGLLQATMELTSARLPVPEDAATKILDARAVSGDLGARKVSLDDGSVLAYDALVIASGARPRKLPASVARSAAPRVLSLRTAADARAMRASIGMAMATGGGRARVVVIGAGLIGHETAESLVEEGHDVVLVDRDRQPLRQVVGESASEWVRQRWGGQVATRFGDGVETITTSTDGSLVVALLGGEELPADLVVSALGVEPDVAWLTDSPLDVADGVLVDDRLRAVGAVGAYAAGDVARVRDGVATGRFQHWGHAVAQGTHAARVVAADLGLAEDPGAFTAGRSFATRLHGRSIVVIGEPTGREVVVLGSPAADDLVVACTGVDDKVRAAVVVGAMKTANKVRPFVNDAMPVRELAAFLEQATRR